MIFIVFFVSQFIIHNSSFAFPIPDTGQTKCYDNEKEIPCPKPGEPFYGQDGNYSINPMSYTKLDASGKDLPDNAAEWVMVRDNVTGLIWEVKQNKDGVNDYSNPHDADNTYTWFDSNPETNGGYAGTPGDGTDTEDFINELNASKFGGYSDWRLPTREELRSIVDYSTSYPISTINSKYFPNSVSSCYFSSTTNAHRTYLVWQVCFNDGHDGYNYKYKSYSRNVRAVRSGQVRSFDHLVINGDGTVTDKNTGLIWEQKTDDGGQRDKDNTYTWKEALTYCENLTLAGQSDWRLPTIKELASIADVTKWNPSIDTEYFPNTVLSYYWSSTTYATYTSHASDVYFLNGYDNYYNKSDSRYVRAVRSGQGGSFDNLEIAQHPQKGPPGKTFDLWGTGFTPNNTVTLHFFNSGQEFFTPTADTDNTGKFQYIYIAPEDMAIGNYSWWATDNATGSKSSNEVTFQITEGPYPEIANFPKTGTVYTTFEQYGTGFTPGGTATLYFFTYDRKPIGTEDVTIEADGTFTIYYDPPDDKAPGKYIWHAIDKATDNPALEQSYEILSSEPPGDSENVRKDDGIQPLPPSRANQGRLMEWDREQFLAYTNSELKLFDNNRPVTTILVHGWNKVNVHDLSEKKWVKQMAKWLTAYAADKTNVIAYNWLEDAYNSEHPSIPPSLDIMEKHGWQLGTLLGDFLTKRNYKGKIHFIAHSAGARVSHGAINLLASEDNKYRIPVELFTTLDAYLFDADAAFDELTNPSWSSISPLLLYKNNAVISLFASVPKTKAKFVDNYLSGVGYLSNIFTLAFIFNRIIPGTNALVLDSWLYYDFAPDFPPEMKFVFRDKIQLPENPDDNYFYSSDSGIIDAVFHKPPVNWYMASMVDQLLNPSDNKENHQYGFYWSPIFGNSLPNKYDLDFLIGNEAYYDLVGSSQLVTDLIINPVLEIKDGVLYLVEKGGELKERLEKTVEDYGTKIIVVGADLYSDAENWITGNAANVYHNTTEDGEYFWLRSGSPTALATNYTIPEDGPFMAFSYKVIQADNTDSIDVFINDEQVYSKVLTSDLTGAIILSEWINVSQWLGQTVRLTFRINSFDGLPLIMELHDMVFAQIGDLEKIWNHDGDADGMADMWEGIYLGDTRRDGSGDADNDGLTDSEEFNFGTSPNLRDSDSDGKDDCTEVQSGSNPLNADDALPDSPSTAVLAASAGPSQTLAENSPVTLHGSALNTTDTKITYHWVQLSGPPAQNITGADTAKLTFHAPEAGPDNATLTFQLTVTDSTGTVATATTYVTSENNGPGDDGGGSGCFISTLFSN